MNKLVTSVFVVISGFAFVGCAGGPEDPTPFEQSISRDTPYDSDAVVDDQYLDEIDTILEENEELVRRPDTEYIKYGKSICILLDQAKDLQVIPEDYDGKNIDQPISQAAISTYCPHHLPE